MPKGPAAKDDGSHETLASPTPAAGGPAGGPARGSPSEWGGIAMLAHCAQTVEEETVPAVPPPGARGRASDEGIKKGSAGENDDGNYSRKEKSLGLLCDKFLQEYSSAAEVCLDAAAKRLGVERRRIYDIVNVLESVEVVSRKAKNRYVWYGVTRLPQALQRQYMLGPPQNDKSDDDDSDASDREAEVPKAGATKRTSRREKSLGVLSQKFVRLFLHAQCGVVSLESAARRLMDEASIDENRLKTKIRRLYDIANILCSLNLIEKTHLADGSRKPAFKWKYPCKHLGLESAPDGGAGMGLKGEGVGGKRGIDGLAGPSKKSKKDKKKASGASGLGAGGVSSLLPGALPSMGSPLVGGAMHPALMMGLLNSMNASSGGSPGKEAAGGAAGGAQTGLAGMLDSPKDMQAYIQAYFAQMAGMQNMLTQLSNPKPDGEGMKDDVKAEVGSGAAKDAAAALAGTGTGAGVEAGAGAGAGAGAVAGADVSIPSYLQMMCAWMSQMSQMQNAGGAASPQRGADGSAAPPPPPPPGKDDAGEGGAAGASGTADSSPSAAPLMPAMSAMDLQAMQQAAALWQMMSAGAINFDGAPGGVLPGDPPPPPPPVEDGSGTAASPGAVAGPAVPPGEGVLSGEASAAQAMRAPGVPAPDEEAGAAAAAVAVAPAEVDGLAGNDSLDSGASTKPDVELSKPDDMLE